MRHQAIQQAMDDWRTDEPSHRARGVTIPGVKSYLPEELKEALGMDWDFAMDALPPALTQPAMQTDPNSAVPAMLTTLIDPSIFKILFTPNKAAIIVGEVRKGTWLDETVMFPQVEHTGEVSSYGDYAESGRAGVNTNWPQRQSYLFQLIKEYGDRELERAGLARINWVNEIDAAAANILNKFSNLTYFYGVQGLQNFGLLNDPNLPASITPAVKAYGGTKWVSGGQILATANEIYTDIQSIFLQLMNQTFGLIEQDSKLVLCMSPSVEVALTATNSFNVNVYDLLKKNFPNIRFENAAQYGVTSTSNPQGQTAGNQVQMIVEEIDGQQTAFAAYNEKMHARPIVRMLSSYRQKALAGTWGTVVRMPFAISSMIGV